MKYLWAPWRMEYIEAPKSDRCIFCLPDRDQDDRERLVLCRGEKSFVIMNRYPYSNGHLMVAPFRHVADLEYLKPEEMAEMHNLLVKCRKVLGRAMAPQGFNVGMNLGEVAGAGIADHLHLHIVPRWMGDTNFMPVFSDTRVVPQHLEETFKILAKEFASV